MRYAERLKQQAWKTAAGLLMGLLFGLLLSALLGRFQNGLHGSAVWKTLRDGFLIGLVVSALLCSGPGLAYLKEKSSQGFWEAFLGSVSFGGDGSLLDLFLFLIFRLIGAVVLLPRTLYYLVCYLINWVYLPVMAHREKHALVLARSERARQADETIRAFALVLTGIVLILAVCLLIRGVWGGR